MDAMTDPTITCPNCGNAIKLTESFTKQWAKREEQIHGVMLATVGMYGNLQGIAGKSIQEIEGLDFAALPGLTNSDEAKAQ
jgi:hypothetical protein